MVRFGFAMCNYNSTFGIRNIIFRRANISIEHGAPCVCLLHKMVSVISTCIHSKRAIPSTFALLICGILWYRLITSYNTNSSMSVCAMCIILNKLSLRLQTLYKYMLLCCMRTPCLLNELFCRFKLTGRIKIWRYLHM